MYLHGIDCIETMRNDLKHKRIGLITNQSGVNLKLQSSIDLLHEKYNVAALYSPEHGVRGATQAAESIDSYTDVKTGLPVISLFGSNRAENPFSQIDCVILDLQDIGVRPFTYFSTLAESMQMCANGKIPLLVLDRYNPLGLSKVSGTLLDERFSSFIGMYELPTRHAMTIGEFARYINDAKGIGCELSVLPCEGLDRNMDFRDCKVQWVQPSPNIPTWDSALCFTGTVLFEGTNLSEGRGTTKPFELIGAPWLQGDRVTDTMNDMHLDGVIFRSAYFTPQFSKFSGELCSGIQIHIIDYDKFEPFFCGLMLLQTIRRMHREFEFIRNAKSGRIKIDLLAGTDCIRNPDFNVERFINSEKAKISGFVKKTAKYRLYE